MERDAVSRSVKTFSGGGKPSAALQQPAGDREVKEVAYSASGNDLTQVGLKQMHVVFCYSDFNLLLDIYEQVTKRQPKLYTHT